MSNPRYRSWGRYPFVVQEAIVLKNRSAPLPTLPTSALAFGNGRSYGDVCLNPGGTLLDARGLDRFISFSPETGILHCESGVTLSEIIDLALPQGWFLPVTPGTRYVTVGGAIANDVHGKNHHRAGSFGHHVRSLELLRSDGERRVLAAETDDGMFTATIGGLGLTGVVTRAELQLRRVPGPWLETETIRFSDLDEFFELSTQSASTHEYTVAWIDCLATGKHTGRGHFIRGDHAAGVAGAATPRSGPRYPMPFEPPLSLVNSVTLRPFNTLYYWRTPRRGFNHYQSYFYPLDGISNWNRIYGPRGFLQHQCVLPPATARDAVQTLLGEIARSKRGSFLAVLKEFGSKPSLGMLSFPRPGTTLALDFPHSDSGVFSLLDRLDRIVADAGGAIYPAKDARMSAALFRQSNPRLQEFTAYRDPGISSGLWRRLTESACNAF
ncbi:MULTISPECIES: FAD-binding oxidoreductase [Pseudoxanthomonas]|uniref:FAD/FMN-containing dehydrogenase n=1 Tax=Pseudoxanthomonas winnipegensis TaxID=2480810 RepID=A0AAW8GES2_9GAMM|nr:MULTISPECIES: FAD-binding oxidoreductase [Pseudoxanthomonas]MDQ1120307.1 FAD/FMN-containing dehydrogenase [Pseudoxanthomonas winnipegensis]MDQ1133522.1 FAD/FMN-containing dehydrogenase [Pseudoxanthomonas winnipegensis]MDR6140235.1 FAD/FMN-containing dehydrogenase [Pseudoxanthomonas sp. SORGH_AS_0997]